MFPSSPFSFPTHNVTESRKLTFKQLAITGYSRFTFLVLSLTRDVLDNEQQPNSRKRSYTEDTEEKKERKGRKAPHELLTDAEKKANHIASEKKRRQNIRIGFDQLIEIVPSLTQGNRSEAFILQKCNTFHQRKTCLFTPIIV